MADFYQTDVLPLSLKEALEHYYAINASFTPYHELKSKRAQKLVAAHDISHIIFGCNTDNEGEIAVQLWTRYCVEIDLPLLEKLKFLFQLEPLKLVVNKQALYFMLFQRKKAKQISEEVKLRRNNMHAKWRYFDYPQFLDRTVGEIRQEFGIQILSR